MLVTATSYTDVRAAARSGSIGRVGKPRPTARPSASSPFIRVARSKRLDPRAWLERELRSGGFLQRYVTQEKGRMPSQIRRVAQRWSRAKPKYADRPKAAREGEWELQYALPARLYFRWLAQDPDFFKDPANLRALRRDNPELCIYR